MLEQNFEVILTKEKAPEGALNAKKIYCA